MSSNWCVILEEAAGLTHDKMIALRFFDLEQAYPKVYRPDLWRLLAAENLWSLQALRNYTPSAVRGEGSLPSAFIPEWGLREGCPSSPVLFNFYRSGKVKFSGRESGQGVGR